MKGLNSGGAGGGNRSAAQCSGLPKLSVMRARAIFLVALGGILVATFVVSCRFSPERRRAAALEERIRSLVFVGMHKDQVHEVLQAGAIAITWEGSPTGHDYTQMQISLGVSISLIDSIEYAITGGEGIFKGPKAWVIITMDGEGVVTAIE